jgi:SRSO17 transposase
MAHSSDESIVNTDRFSGGSTHAEDEPMITIGAIPRILEPFLAALRPWFSKPQFRHFGPLLVAYAVVFGRRNVDALYATMQETTCRQKLNDFMVESPWPGEQVLREAATFTLEMMKPKPGERLEILIDGSAKRKRGKATDAVGYVKEAGSTVFVPGHKYLKVALRFRGVVLPWAIDIYIPKKFFRTREGKDLAERTGRRFRTLNEMTADIVAALPAEWAALFKVYVLMDSGFCNPTVCDAVRQKGFHFLCAAQSTRTFWMERRRGKPRKVRLATHAPGVLRYQGHDVDLEPKRRGGKARPFRLATQTGSMNGIGRVRCVFSKRKSDGSVLTLVTSDLDLSAEEVATGYGWRWEIEVTLKALKQHLGLGDYQHRWFEGAVHHLHLSCLAHLALTVTELTRLGAQSQRKNAVLQLPSTRELQNRLRAIVWQDTLRQLCRPSCRDEILYHLQRSLRLEEEILGEAA